MRAASLINELGCNGSGFDLSTCLFIFKAFVRPIMEYCLALCPLRVESLIEKYHAKCIPLMTGCGRISSVSTVGLFGDVHHPGSRLRTLKYKYFTAARRKGALFGIFYAKRAHEMHVMNDSCFRDLTSNPYIQAEDEERNGALLQRRDPSIPRVRGHGKTTIHGSEGSKDRWY